MLQLTERRTTTVAPDYHAQLRDVSRVFERPRQAPLHAMGPVTIDFVRGEFFTVVGPSGCGKSSLLEIIAGLALPTSGEVIFEGRPHKGVPEGIGVIFQEDASFPWLTVADNVAFGLRRNGTDPAETKRRVDHALGLMGLREFARAYPTHLSGGMRQRVCIARTLVMQPRFILLDEPFGALDQQTRLIMGDELLKLWRETRATVLLITHALDEAAMLSDRVGVMSARPGRVIECVETGWPRDRTSEILSDPTFAKINAQLWRSLREEAIKLIGENRV
ncbi:MAG: ABC transporter ATP-binding protein [Methylovirgula sp.]|uniref:ABC transporter ATP-binding protein n=1 Tax=Methylovirgula sp. TaxID=1978224 RepID=UPI003075EF74